jgi:hypothetical protein
LGSLPVASYVGVDDPNAMGLCWILIVSSVLMTSAAAFAWAWIPEVQEPRHIGEGYKMPSKTLEDLGSGNNGIKANGIGFQGKTSCSEGRIGRNELRTSTQ